MTRGNGLWPGPWDALEEAARAAGAEVAEAPRQGHRRLMLPGVAEDVDVTPSADMEQLRCVMDLPAAAPRQDAAPGAIGSAPVVPAGAPDAAAPWATTMVLAQERLALGRAALVGGHLTLRWDLDARRGEALADGVGILGQDAVGWRAFIKAGAAAVAGAAPDPGGTPGRDSRAEDDRRSSAVDKAVEEWRRDRAPSCWDVTTTDLGWRLVRSEAATRGLPPVCELVPRGKCLGIATTVWLPAGVTADLMAAVAAFILRQNGRLAVRFGLRVSTSTGELTAVMERRLATAGLSARAVDEGLAAVVAAYRSTHREIKALCVADVARWAAICATSQEGTTK